MAIRSRILNKPVRNNTGLKVLGMLIAQGHERTFCQRAICQNINTVWGLNAYDPKIADAELSYPDRSLNIMTADGVIHHIDISDMFPDG